MRTQYPDKMLEKLGDVVQSVPVSVGATGIGDEQIFRFILDKLGWDVYRLSSRDSNRTYAKSSRRRYSFLSYDEYCLRRYALLEQFCVSPYISSLLCNE